jgi:Fe2+ transport system protein FeoA
MAPLASLDPGSSGRLVRIDGERSFRRRLMELGLLPGARVQVVRRVDLGGLIELEVRGCRVTVRRSEADLLFVDREAA